MRIPVDLFSEERNFNELGIPLLIADPDPGASRKGAMAAMDI